MRRLLKNRVFLSVVTAAGLLAFVPVWMVVFHPISGTITYATTWDTEGISIDADGTGWTVTNDLGYRVHVERGFVVTHSATMTACDHTTGLFDWIGSLFQPLTAHAGHTSLGVDPAAMNASTVESLTDFAPRTLGTRTVNELSYCKGHTLAARADANTANLPADLDLSGVSLWIEGSYRAPNGEDDVPFQLQTGQAYGLLFDLTGADGETVHPVVGRPITVILERRLAPVFDGVDFADSPDSAYNALKSWIRATKMRVSAGESS